MSVFPVFPTSSPPPPSQGQEPIPHCDARKCYTDEIQHEDIINYTTTLKTLETITTVAVLVTSSFLLLILLIGTRRFTVPFFRMLTVLIVVIVIRSILSITLKLFTLWTGVMIANQNIITLVADILSKKLIILLIFLLAFNRFAVILYPILDTLLFARYRYIISCLVCCAISAAATYTVVTTSNMQRQFIPGIGFIDYVESAMPYEIISIISLVFAFLSVLLHLVIIVCLRCRRSTTSVNTAKVQRRMFREVALMTLVNAIFNLLFILLYHIPYSYESRIMIISLYNILCFIPDILIPVFILIGSREVHAEISSRLSFVKITKVPPSGKSVTLNIKS